MPVGGPSFSSVRKARAALKEKALETYHLMCQIIKQAAAAGDYETAAKYTAWLLDHTPDEDGERVLGDSVDKKQIEVAKSPIGPTIQIGVSIGGVQPPKPLPAPEAIEVVEVKSDDNS